MRHIGLVALHAAAGSRYYFSQVRYAGRCDYAQKQSGCPAQRRWPSYGRRLCFRAEPLFV